MSTVLTVQNVGFSYPPSRRGQLPRRALSNITFSVARGEMLSLLGPNGGGKSTLFRIMATAVPPQEGTVELFGENVTTRAHSVRARIGVVFQSPALDPYLTVEENLVCHGHLYGRRGAALRQRIEEGIERFGLKDRLRDLAGTLSGGQKRRVELVKALVPDPELLLLDEASSGLDPAARFEWRQQLEALRREKNLTIVMTTHFMDEAEACTRVGLIDSGTLVALGTPVELKSEVLQPTLWLDLSAPFPEAELSRIGVRARRDGSRVGFERASGPTLEDVFLKRTGHQFE